MTNPRPSSGPLPGSRPSTFEKTEQFLLQRLAENPGQRGPALLVLASFYSQADKPEEALRHYAEAMPLLLDPGERAACALAMGGAAEEVRDYEAAVLYYREAMTFEPASREAWYFTHNNLGFSLNQLGRFSEGESCCRTAIGILPERPNAHKNLGLALVGLGRLREAAQCFIESTRVRPVDTRSCAHLEDLLEQHPELKAEFAGASRDCRALVTAATAWKN